MKYVLFRCAWKAVGVESWVVKPCQRESCTMVPDQEVQDWGDNGYSTQHGAGCSSSHCPLSQCWELSFGTVVIWEPLERVWKKGKDKSTLEGNVWPQSSEWELGAENQEILRTKVITPCGWKSAQNLYLLDLRWNPVVDTTKAIVIANLFPFGRKKYCYIIL